MSISFETSGSFDNLEKFLGRVSRGDIYKALEAYAQQGVSALRSATPVASGATAAAWSYEVTRDKGSWTITWLNAHNERGFPVAIMLQYGHGTGTGGYVQGRDYINPAIKPVFDKIADEVWKAVTAA